MRVAIAVMLVLAGLVLADAQSYHQARPTREQIAQWEANLGFAGLSTHFNGGNQDPELEGVVDPTLEAELQSLEEAESRRERKLLP